jgi:choline dehydrogenase-like flavoprotein
VIARPENRVTVDPNRKDASGIPVAVVRFRFGENDLALWRDSNRSWAEICSKIKGTLFMEDRIQPPGFASHEVGTARMGTDPKRSVLNSYCQAPEVKNLFVTDGNAFTTSSEKNPTLTIMVLSLRAADYMKEQRRKGEL